MRRQRSRSVRPRAQQAHQRRSRARSVKPVAVAMAPRPMIEQQSLYYAVHNWGFGSQWLNGLLAAYYASQHNLTLQICEQDNAVGHLEGIISPFWQFGFKHEFVRGQSRENSFNTGMFHGFARSQDFGTKWQWVQSQWQWKPSVVRSFQTLNEYDFEGRKSWSLGLHVRRGDKRTEAVLRTATEYLQAIEQWMSQKEFTSLYVATDDWTWCERELLPSLKRKHSTLVIHHLAEPQPSQGHDQMSFNRLPLQTKRQQLWRFARDVYNLTCCAYAIVTCSSNIGALVDILHPHNAFRERVKSLDDHILHW